MTTIYRRQPDAFEAVELPKDAKVCPSCEGKGYPTKYDQGWSSLAHDPSLNAPERCWLCNGQGFITAEDPYYENVEPK